jgi:hypothetical protein
MKAIKESLERLRRNRGTAQQVYVLSVGTEHEEWAEKDLETLNEKIQKLESYESKQEISNEGLLQGREH